MKLAARLSRAVPAGHRLPVLLEVNVSGEASKEGFAPSELDASVEAIAALPGLHIEGLMTMAPIVPDPEEARPVFRQLRLLRDDLARRHPAIPWTPPLDGDDGRFRSRHRGRRHAGSHRSGDFRRKIGSYAT